MKTTAIGIFVVLALSFLCPFTALSNTEERFGPWLYYAPYYFPPDGCCLGYCFRQTSYAPSMSRQIHLSREMMRPRNAPLRHHLRKLPFGQKTLPMKPSRSRW